MGALTRKGEASGGPEARLTSAYREVMTTAPAGTAGPMTAEQLIELSDDGWHYELLDGELRKMAPAGNQHGRVALKIGRRIGNHVEQATLGECYGAETGFLVRRDPDTVRAPDVAFIRADRVPSPDETGFSEVVPDLVVEVVSPSDRASEVTKKALFWLEVGVRVVWVVDPAARVITLHRSGDVIGLLQGDDSTLSGEDVLPGFTARLGDLFA